MQALVNVGADLVKLVPGRVSTEVDARLAYDTDGIVKKVLILTSLAYLLVFKQLMKSLGCISVVLKFFI